MTGRAAFEGLRAGGGGEGTPPANCQDGSAETMACLASWGVSSLVRTCSKRVLLRRSAQRRWEKEEGGEGERKKKESDPPSLPPPSTSVRVSSVSSGVPGVHTLTQSQSSVHILYPLCTPLRTVVLRGISTKQREEGERVKRVLLSQWIPLQETPTCPVQDIPPINMSLSKKDFSFSPSYKPPYPPIPA